MAVKLWCDGEALHLYVKKVVASIKRSLARSTRSRCRLIKSAPNNGRCTLAVTNVAGNRRPQNCNVVEMTPYVWMTLPLAARSEAVGFARSRSAGVVGTTDTSVPVSTRKMVPLFSSFRRSCLALRGATTVRSAGSPLARFPNATSRGSSSGEPCSRNYDDNSTHLAHSKDCRLFVSSK